ncbi:hypothetical protein GLP30_11090 [Photobacterium phosphoreum]|uniref:Uncharacterized protein n=1 Tax=Photobacterium phosphoreum TaxID=659 RepID=A0AAW4ZVS0_PHOPO|nr:hypothetical protein [Photobacterium phosphoreum]MCD9491366.1 hypothetical protein [Photobacterium phosphoreum]MCD9502405.1 hypothetical protein [Photobacterium phosphoreum]MCF2190632.1 hypothetical protein [Photobacterium phosphoreum]MCF2302181.1 hypothetical protein [Photobacterium phosphoreum]
MSNDYKKEINQGLTMIRGFLKTKISLQISYGLIGAGLSILGFNNLVPYILIVIEPSLKDTVMAQNDIYTAIAVFLIIFASVLPILIQVFEYYKRLYINDLQRINVIRSEYTRSNFNSTINDIKTNLALFDFQTDKLEDLSMLLLNPDFMFYDKKLTVKAKEFATKLSEFHSMLSIRLHPAPTGSVYVLPSNKRSTAVVKEICNSGDDVYKLFDELFKEIEKFEQKKLMRFFA